jgi:hypothetical protein
MEKEQLLGPILHRLIIAPQARRLSWAQLQDRAGQAKSRFDALLEGLTEAQLLQPVRKAELASIADVTAHLGTAHWGMTRYLGWIASGSIPAQNLDWAPLFAGAQGRPFSEIRVEYEANWQALQEVARNEALAKSPLVCRHLWMGDMTAKEWLCLVATHYQYHIRQVRSFRRRL